ncbi:MAG: YfhO family protein [Chlorobiaceae bacterium]|nr:YfhO family protein [Chlorobiaceae bacterium]
MKKAAWPYLAATILLMLLGALLYGKALLLLVVPGSPDSITPMALSRALDALRARTGAYPLWAPWSFSGMPTVEAFSYLSGLYLPNLLFDLLRLDGVHTQWLHLVFAGMGGYALGKRLGLQDAPAFLAGSAFMLNPFMTAMFAFGHGSQLMTVAWMPWALWAALGLAGRGKVSDAGILALVLGLQLQRAHVQIAYYTWMLVVPFLAVMLASGARAGRNPTRAGLLAVAALALGLGVAMQIYLPALDYLPASARAAGSEAGEAYRYSTMWSMHPAELLTWILPGSFGFGGATYWGFMPFTDFPNYAGIVVLLFAVAGIVAGRRKPQVLFFAGAAIIFLLISFGSWFSPVYDLFYHFAPLFKSFRVPSMALVAVSLCLAVLSGYGLQAFVDKPPAETAPVLRAAAVAVGILAVLFLSLEGTLEQLLRSRFPLVQVESPEIASMVDNLRWSLWRGSLFMLAMGIAATAGLVWLAARKIVTSGQAALLLVLLSAGDLLLVDRQILFPDDRSLRPSPLVARPVVERALGGDEVTGFLSKQAGVFRIYPVGPLFSENKFGIAGIESVGGYHAAKLGAYQELLSRSSNLANIGVLRMLNVRYVISPAPLDYPELSPAMAGTLRTSSGDLPVAVYELSGTMPRAWFASSVTSVADDAAAIDAVMSGGGAPSEAWATGLPWQGTRRYASGTLLSIARAPESISMKVSAESDAFLVLSEVSYPKRWKLTIDGREANAVKVDGVIRGVELKAGKHDVRFTYDRSCFETGRALSMAAIAASFLMVAGGAVSARLAGRGTTQKKKAVT